MLGENEDGDPSGTEERTRRDAQVAVAERLMAIGRLAASVAHELNNPLAYVLLNLELLERELPRVSAKPRLLPECRERVGLVREGVERMAAIVGHLRTVARSEEVAFEPVDVAEALSWALAAVPAETRVGARFDLELGPLPRVRANRDRLQQAFLVLLLNAAEAMHDSSSDRGVIVVRARAEAGENDEPVRAVVIEVCDDGSGIEPALLDRVFEPFFTTKESRVGLGLWLTRTIVSALGGQVEAENVPGGGATFRVRLPVEPRPASEALARLESLRRLLAQAEPSDERAMVRIHAAFIECRFAFRDVLHHWRDDQEALRGMQELLELMVGYELDAGQLELARRLLAELPQPRPALEARLQQLRELVARERAAVEELSALGRRMNTSIGTGTRALILAAMGVIWALMYFGLGHATRAGIIGARHEIFLGVNASYGLFLLVAMRIWRRVLWGTDVNKRFLWTLWAAFLAGLVLWPAGWAAGIPFTWCIALTMLLYGTVVWMSAAAVDMKLVWASGPYWAGFGAALAFPAYAWEAMGLATLVAMGVAAAMWRPTRRGGEHEPQQVVLERAQPGAGSNGADEQAERIVGLSAFDLGAPRPRSPVAPSAAARADGAGSPR